QPSGAEAVLLVKPQFEVGKGRVGKGGVVRDPVAHCDAIEGVVTAATGLGLVACGLVASPITGPAGNHEYLLWLRRSDCDGQVGMADGAGDAFEPVEQLVEPAQSDPKLRPAPISSAPISPEQIKTLVASTLAPRA
ncbi:MAG: hypothetical protein NWR94_00775, partial [Cyanobium sp. MAG_237]|nr:hypothetical protein [Cyanobium sp. MAG_237]